MGFGMLQMLQKFAAFFHDGQIGGKVGIEHIVKANAAQGGDHPAHSGLAGLQAQLLGPSGPDGGRHLDDSDFIGVCQSVKNLLGVVPLPQSAHRALGDTLAAQRAVRLFDFPVQRNVYCGAGTGGRHVPDIQTLDLVADLDAAHTFDAFGGVPDQGEALVPAEGGDFLFKGDVQDIQVVGNGLQRAISAADAGGALSVVLRKQQLHIDAPGFADLGAVGQHFHSFFHRVVAGGDQLVHAGQLHHAHPAGADIVDIPQITQAGDLYPRRPGRV